MSAMDSSDVMDQSANQSHLQPSVMETGLVRQECNMTEPFCCFNETANSTMNCTGQGNPYTQEWYIQLIYYFFFVAMIVIATGGNIIVVWIVLAHKRMRTVTNYFLVNLAIADALISIFNTSMNFTYLLNQDWWYGRAWCKIVMFTSPFTISASVFTFMAIALDRYKAIIHPLKPRLPSETIFLSIFCIWTAALVVAVPNLIYATTHKWDLENCDTRTVCYLEWPDGVYMAHDHMYNVILLLLNYFIPLVILAVTYAMVGKALWGSQTIGENVGARHGENVKSKRKIVKMMIVIVAIFAVCWFPMHLYYIIVYHFPDLTLQPFVQHLYLVFYWLAMSNSMYNPLVYCWMNQRFRQGFRYIFRWLPCSKRMPRDPLDRAGTAISMRYSPSDDHNRNGSMSQTVVESLDDCSAPLKDALKDETNGTRGNAGKKWATTGRF
ncbi:unnamed protein product [Owenia fusiformis]|uniref:G-protein coupled receptors family 1 profile domain-containing protein n=1 Tax=Owenia fusiformis TaxID=6347 RepID=A0A8S4PMT6_OWEFU|nr:unnamed protein product [Owenia fusiformis]